MTDLTLTLTQATAIGGAARLLLDVAKNHPLWDALPRWLRRGIVYLLTAVAAGLLELGSGRGTLLAGVAALNAVIIAVGGHKARKRRELRK